MMRKLNVLLIAAVIVLATTSANAAMTAPFNVVATPRSTSTIDLTWTDSNLNVTAFEVERSLDPERSFSVVATVTGGARTFRNGGLATATMYYYRVRAVVAGRASRRSNVASARTFSTTILPSATTTPVRTATPIPTLTATRTAAPTLTQTPVATATSTRTATPTVTPTRTPTVTATTTVTATVTVTRTATAVPTSTVTITATPIRTATPVASATPTVTATPDTVPPAPPTSLSAAPRNCTQLDLAWVASSDDGSGLKAYNVYRSGVFLKQVLAPSTTTSDSGLSGGSAYAYTARAVDYADNVSGPSNTATANTPACNQPPVAQIGPDRSATVATSVSFDGSASYDPNGSITAYAWNFGDGTSASGAAVSHAYQAAGAYTVSLTVTDNAGAQGSDTAAITVTATGGAAPWSDSHGGLGDDRGRAVAVDASGNVVLGGYFSGTADFGGGPRTSNIFSGIGNPNLVTDAIVAKYTSSGGYQWDRQIGAEASDYVNAVAFDGNGDVVVTGAVANDIDFGNGLLNTNSLGGTDIFVAKYAGSNGSYRWAQRIGGKGYEAGYALAVDGSNNVVVAGHFQGTIAFGGGVTLTAMGGDMDRDIFVAKYSPGGVLQWAKRFGSSAAYEYAYGVAMTSNGEVAVTGAFFGAVNFGGATLTSAGGYDIFVAKYAANGAHQWSQRFGGTGDDYGQGVVVDAAGNVVVTGNFSGTASFGSSTLTSAGGPDVFVAKYAATGAHQWSKRFGGGNSDGGAAVTLDASGNVVVTGAFSGTVDFGAGPLSSAGGPDLFVAKYAAATGAYMSAKRFGGTGADAGQGIALDTTTGATVETGYFQSSLDFGQGPLTSAGGFDIFLAYLGP